MNRRVFLSTAAGSALAAESAGSLRRHIRNHPLAITMWDFSWLERRWPGAGYEDWPRVLAELKARGYDAIRIDAYPHLIHHGAEKTWELLPEWSVQDWGAPARCRVQVQPALNQFIRECARAGLQVGLSTWFRQDVDDQRLKIRGVEDFAAAWKSALDSIAAAGLLGNILYVDLCNEFPLNVWTPFLPKGFKRATAEGERWMRESIAILKKSYPQLDYTFSFTSEYDSWQKQDVNALDFLELHLWMTHFSDFYKQVGYTYDRFDRKSYDNLALHGEKLYREKPDWWQSRLKYGIDLLADWQRASHKPLITTECWAVVDYKDFPMLDWGWVKELSEVGVRYAASKGQWVAMATSNFCGPQFHGMWRDVAWHRRMTGVIHGAKLAWG